MTRTKNYDTTFLKNIGGNITNNINLFHYYITKHAGSDGMVNRILHHWERIKPK